MGLDMYLYKKTYVRNWEHTPAEDRYQVSVTRNGQPVARQVIDPERVSYIVEHIGSWRKANAIHQWFVEHVQHGNDNCGAYFVSRERLAELLHIVNRVLASIELVEGRVTTGYRIENGHKAAVSAAGKVVKDPSRARELLPTQAGFFFGSTDYDERYYLDLIETQRILDEAMDGDGDEFEYTSSW